jgi:hypothetical protein
MVLQEVQLCDIPKTPNMVGDQRNAMSSPSEREQEGRILDQFWISCLSPERDLFIKQTRLPILRFIFHGWTLFSKVIMLLHNVSWNLEY